MSQINTGTYGNIPRVCEVRIIVHDLFADFRIDIVEVGSQIYSPVQPEVGRTEEAVDVVHVRSVDPGRISDQEALTMFEHVLER